LSELLLPLEEDAGALSDRLIDEFGSLGALLAAPAERRARLDRGAERALAHLAVVRRVILHVLRSEAIDGTRISSTDEVAAYLRVDMAYEAQELVRILFLGSDNRLIADEVMFRGTIDQAPLFPRAIVHRALDRGAAALILVHNHPSGDAAPSRADLRGTADLVRACELLDIVVHDHIIVGRHGWTSFKSRGLM
jgi:DNA repair protein RadC